MLICKTYKIKRLKSMTALDTNR